jgi:hypothetical protein
VHREFATEFSHPHDGPVAMRFLRRQPLTTVLLACSIASWAGLARAGAPFRATGHASLDDESAPAPRTLALQRARRAALEAALEGLEGAVDARARELVLARAQAWTGAYRVLAQHDDGATVTVELEVEIDIERLRKEVVRQPQHAGPARSLVFGGVASARGCDRRQLRRGRLADYLVRLGGLSRGRKGTRVRLELRCEDLGTVANTHLEGARVSMRALGPEGVLAAATAHGFGNDDLEAADAAMHAALPRLAAELGARRRGELRLHVRSPWPAARLRRLEQTLARSVVGVRHAEVVGMDAEGAITLLVRGSVDAREMAAGMRRLSSPGFSVNLSEVSGDEALTISLD